MRRREFLASGMAAAAPPGDWAERLGIMCQLGASEQGAKTTLAAAREAGFRRIMVNFPWDRVDAAYVRGLPAWVREADLRCVGLGAYVNCLHPETVLMSTREEDFPRAVELAAEMKAGCLVAWTGGNSPDLMKRDERNFAPSAQDEILRFLQPRLRSIQAAGLRLALETYITLACPDAPTLRALLNRLPECCGAVLDPPNLTPPARYAQRDEVLKEMVNTLRGRIAMVHLKDFRMSAGGAGYDLPGPMMGEMNYRLFVDQIRALPGDIPVIAEHLNPPQFAEAREKLLRL